MHLSSGNMLVYQTIKSFIRFIQVIVELNEWLTLSHNSTFNGVQKFDISSKLICEIGLFYFLINKNINNTTTMRCDSK